MRRLRWRRFWEGYVDGARSAGVHLYGPPWFAAAIERELADVRYLRYRTGYRIGRDVAISLRVARDMYPDVSWSPAATARRAILEHLGRWDE